MAAGQLTGGAAILARLRQQRVQPAVGGDKTPEKKTVCIAFGSQTGTAQDIARSIHDECQSRSIKSKVVSLNELGFQNVSPSKTPIVIVIVSSTGDGDPPDNCQRFFRELKKKNVAGHLKGVQFTCLGLGDSNYTSFMHVPRTFNKKFKDMGAGCFYKSIEADEVDGLESVTEQWVDGLWSALKKAMEGESSTPTNGVVNESKAINAELTVGEKSAPVVIPETASKHFSTLNLENLLDDNGVQGIPALPQSRVKIVWGSNESNDPPNVISHPLEGNVDFREENGNYTSEQPFWAPVTDARLMTADWSDRRVLHVELDLTGSNMKYNAGDSLGILPRNDPEIVSKLIQRLKLHPNASFHVASTTEQGEEAGEKMLSHLYCPCQTQQAFLYCCDVTSIPRKGLLRFLAENCENESEKKTLLFLSSRSGRDAYKHYVMMGQPSLLDILTCFPSCNPPLAGLLDLLPPLPPRMYSLTTSQAALPNTAQFAFTLAKYETPYGSRLGVATSWLNELLAPIFQGENNGRVCLPVFLRSGGVFGLPNDLERPLVMIGPGTGVAPFRGFLQERKVKLKVHDGPVGECWLFFGCRRKDEDYLYKEDFENFVQDGVLSNLEVAFSRETSGKVYVQHKMKMHSKSLYEIIFEQEGCMFVCGDGAMMAKDVHACLTGILQQHGGVSEKEAGEKLMQMTKAGRYVRDIWS